MSLTRHLALEVSKPPGLAVKLLEDKTLTSVLHSHAASNHNSEWMTTSRNQRPVLLSEQKLLCENVLLMFLNVLLTEL